MSDIPQQTNADDLQQISIDLMSLRSITPDDAGCSNYIAHQLQQLGFSLSDYSQGETTNTWLQYGSAKQVVVFAGHTDVVPSGDIAMWQNDPFQPQLQHGKIFARGAVDMKGALASMLHACQIFFADKPQLAADVSFAWALTSDEEGSGKDGMPVMLTELKKQNKQIKYVLVGEPTSGKVFADTMRIARRGSLSGKLSVRAKQGHVAYPELAKNAINFSLPLLKDLAEMSWPAVANSIFPATQLQLVNLNSGLGASNIIPGELILDFNIRYAPEINAAQIQKQIIDVVESHLGNDYSLLWQHSAKPYQTTDKEYIEKVASCIKPENTAALTINGAGGTSDARHFAAFGAQVVEFGLCNATAHKINENVSLDDLLALSEIYQRYLNLMLNDVV